MSLLLLFQLTVQGLKLRSEGLLYVVEQLLERLRFGWRVSIGVIVVRSIGAILLEGLELLLFGHEL